MEQVVLTKERVRTMYTVVTTVHGVMQYTKQRWMDQEQKPTATDRDYTVGAHVRNIMFRYVRV